MKDKEWKVKKKQVKDIFDKWSRRMGLGWYKIEIEWKAGDPPDKGEGNVVVADISTQWMYRTANMRVWLECLPEEEHEIERIIVHELSHIFVNPLRSQENEHYNYDLEEYCVESLTQAFMWTYQDGIKDGGKLAKKQKV